MQEVPERLRAEVLRAEKNCPERAIEIEPALERRPARGG
jgi:ferredoxin